MDDAALRKALLAWYRREARDLPWRRTRDPYDIWVSEVMLQQTRVDVATPYYGRWLQRFPTVAALAAADEDEVLRLWAGLGYYSRARNLHKGAKAIVAAGSMPATAEQWHALPGVGRYTAGAVASIAAGERVPAVDGNVVRVLARLHGWPGSASSPTLRAKVEAAAERLVPAGSAGDWNQALMDLGATVCTPRNPRCAECPVATLCKARADGTQDRIPGPKRSKAPVAERRWFAVVERDGHVLLVRNPARGLLAGMWSLPGGNGDGRAGLVAAVQGQTGLEVRLLGRTGRTRHQFSHRTWDLRVQRAEVVEVVGAGRVHDAAKWVRKDDLAGEALPGAMRVALSAVPPILPLRPTAAPKPKAKTAQRSRRT